MPNQSRYPEILLPMAGEQVFVKTEEIVYLEAKGSYSDVHLKDGRQARISKKLKDAWEILGTEQFVRIHHSYVINLAYLVGFKSGENTAVQLKDGTILPISRSKKAEFFNFFKRL